MAAKEQHDSRVHFIAFLPSLIPLLRRAALIVEGDPSLIAEAGVGPLHVVPRGDRPVA